MLFRSLIWVSAISCSSDKVADVVKNDYVDSIIDVSRKSQDSSSAILKLAEKKTSEVITGVATKVENMRNEISALKSTIRVTKATIIRDTIFVTEKKNFWGRTKTTIDSSESTQDSTEHEEIF